ncbi:STAS domain-containing protein [Azospirillum sp.]|uniref:STAS domain-containing protein n=1 Tax=Azospirillum sp. TaxID=34012 RepID=UPI00262CDBAA|nr:STAS domain-containing protein [Azospirillum sp.]
MNYTVRDLGGVREVELRGQLTFESNDDFRQIIDGMEKDGIAECVLNLGGLDFIDSAGLGLLVLANNAGHRASVQLKMKHPRGQVRDMIEISEFHTIIPCEF